MTGIAIAASFAAGVMLGWLGLLLILTAAAVWWLHSRKAAVPVIFVIAALAGWARLSLAGPQQVGVIESGASTFTGEVVGPAFSTARGQSFKIDIAGEASLGDEWVGGTIFVCVYGPDQPRVGWGDSLSISGRFESVHDVSRGFASALRARSCDGVLTSGQMTKLAASHSLEARIDGFRQSISEVIMGSADGDRGALLTGLVTGDDGALSGAAADGFLDTGTSHITAVSGSNFALIVVIAAAVGSVGGVRRRFAWIVVTVTGIWAYAFMVGLGAPSFRAALIATLATGAILTGRRADFLTLAMVGMAIQLAIRPEDQWTLSFQLSMASSLALVLVLGAYHLDDRRPFWLSAIVATSAAQLATLALLVSTVGRVSVISVPANMVIGPLAAIAFPLAAVGGVIGTAVPLLGQAILAPASIIAGVIVWIARTAGSTSWASQEVGASTSLTVIFLAVLAIIPLAILSQDVRVQFMAVARTRSSIRLLSDPILFALIGGVVVGIAVRTLVN